MAGMGKRLRPHTLVTPKPLIPVAGTPIVERLVRDIASLCVEPIEEIAFVVGHFGDAVEKQLLDIAQTLGAKGSIHYQNEALGTGHAVLCAESALSGPVIVAFADTLFTADFRLSDSDEAMIWVKKIEDPSAFGVVKLDEDGYICDFVEKPKTFVSDLAIIGIYYFRDGLRLKQELKRLIEEKIVKSGEYQLTDALLNLKNAGVKFRPGTVNLWMDCGNKDATVDTNATLLNLTPAQNHIHPSAIVENSVILPPVFIGDKATVKNSVVGPAVSIGEGAAIEQCIVENSIVREYARLSQQNLSNSMIGAHAIVRGSASAHSLGDYSVLE